MSLAQRIWVRRIHASSPNYRGPLTIPGWYPRDHKPPPYPTTEDERRAAAIKYGLRPEDYKPISFDDVTRHAGAYPDLGTVTYSHKDPYDHFTDSWNRRNWGEPVIMSYLWHRGDRNSFTGLEAEDFQPRIFFPRLIVVLSPIFFFAWYYHNSAKNEQKRLYYKIPMMPKQYPYDYAPTYPMLNPRKYPITNYTFEPAE